MNIDDTERANAAGETERADAALGAEPRAQADAEDGDVRLDPDLPHFTNMECPYFPCHDDIEPALFNCLFCFCPLYALGAECGGNPVFTEDGVKDCSQCTLPHRGNAGNRLVNKKFPKLSDLARCERTGLC